MRIIKVSLPTDHELVFFGDNHEGNALQSVEDFEACIEYIRTTKNAFAIHMGDEIEGITMDDERYNEAAMEALKRGEGYNRPLEQMKTVKRRLMPIRHKLITILYGNHPRRLERFGNLTEQLCNELEIPFGTISCKIHVTDKRGNLMYKVFAMHGAKYIGSTSPDEIRRRANMQNILVRHLERKAGDCLIMAKGHNHLRLLVQPERKLFLVDDGSRIRGHYTEPITIRKSRGRKKRSQDDEVIYYPPDLRWYVGTASFLRMYKEGISSYQEQYDFDPPEIGYAKFFIEGGKVVNAEFEIFK